MTVEEFKLEYLRLLNLQTFDESKKDHYVILVCGKRIAVSSGKCIWNSKGAAKNALRNHLESLRIGNQIEPVKIHDPIYSRDTNNWNAMSLAARVAQDEWMDNNAMIISLSDYIKGQVAGSKK